MTQAGNVGIATATPVARLQVAGDVALNSMASGAARPLPVGATLIWNDGTWLRLNQNLDFTKPIFGVHTPGLFASGSLNVGGAGGWTDPGPGNLRVKGTSELDGATTINSSTTINGPTTINGATSVNGGTKITGGTVVDGAFNVTGSKNFLIPHPMSPASKCLVHSSLEGPEVAVFYRGEAHLQNGTATVTLPPYFEALTRAEARTVLLTPIVENDEPVSALAATRVRHGRFTVRMIADGNPSQCFWWEVKALRADLPALEVELDAPLGDAERVLAGSRG